MFTGYGNTAPRTASGKILTMFYAVVGVPLMLLWLSNIGTLMANTFKFAYSHSCCPSPSYNSRSVQNKRPPSSRTEPSSIQVKYSVSAKTCETHVVQEHGGGGGPRGLSRREQRAALRSLDPAAKQVLMECAEYNVSMDQDERSRRILQQLHSAANNENGNNESMSGIEEESSNDDVDSVIDMRGMGGDCDLRGGGIGVGGSVVGISINGGTGSHCLGMEGTPSKVPLLLHRGNESGPDLVEVEALDEQYGNNGRRSVSPERQHRPFSEQRVPISLVLIFVVIYIMGGATVFSIWEEWNFLDSAYFCFITLSTIGLGEREILPNIITSFHIFIH